MKKFSGYLIWYAEILNETPPEARVTSCMRYMRKTCYVLVVLSCQSLICPAPHRITLGLEC